jgi:hypothetical protein
MIKALKENNGTWFKKLLAVRDGQAFVRIAAIKSGKRVQPLDPLRTVLARLAQLQEDDRRGLISMAEVSEHLNSALPPDQIPADDKTIRTAGRDVGLRFDSRRGRKPGGRNRE